MTLTNFLVLAALCVLVSTLILALLACWWLQRATHATVALQSAVAAGLTPLWPGSDDGCVDMSRVATGFLVLPPGGALRGPVELATLRAMLIDGRLGEGALARPAAFDDWRPAREIAAADEGPAVHPGSNATSPFAAHRKR